VRAATLTSHPLTLSSSLKAVTCLDTSTCFGVGAGGIVSHTTNGGTSWDVGGTQTYATLAGVACPLASVCFAAGAGGAIESTSNSGASWAAQTSNTTQDLNAVACLSTTTCYAVGAGGTILAASNGSSWSAQASGTAQNLFGVACPGGTTCVAVGAAGTIVATTDGSTWTARTSNTTAQLNAVGCVRFTTTCYAVGSGSTFTKTADLTAWTAGSILQTSFSFNAISCAAASTCEAVGQIGFVFGTTDGSTWNSQPSGTTQAFSGVACPSTVACFVVGASGTILATANAGTNWSGETAAYAGQINAIACPSTSVCYAAGGVIGGTTDGGATWSILTSARGEVLRGISCPATATCSAVGSGGLILATTDGGASWSSQTPVTTALSGIACPAAALCYAVGAGGRIETNAGGSWHDDNSPTTNPLTSIACPGPSTCFAVGGAGTIVRTTNGAQWGTPTSGTTGGLFATACATGGVCLALVNAGGGLLMSIDNGATWAGGAFSPAPPAFSVACPAPTICIGVSANGIGDVIMTSADAGSSWSQQLAGGTEELLSVACPSLTLCAIGTGSGHVFMATSPATAVSIGSSANPAAAGQPLTLTATLSGCPSAPSGTVAFFDGLSLLGSAPISGGQAQLTTSNVAAGSQQLTASYGGDANCGAAVSNPLSEGVTPAIPSLITPANGATGQSTTPALSWTNSAGAASFTIGLTDATANRTLPNLSSAAAALTVPSGEGLVVGHQYSWSVAACNAIGCSPFSSAFTFTTAAVTPGVVTLVSPLEGAQNVSLTPTLAWNAPSGAVAGTTQYTAYIWDPGALVMKFQQATTALSIGVPGAAGLQPSVFYFWTVQACTGSVCGPVARWEGFTTTAAPGTPSLVSPIEGSQTVSTTPTLQWTAASGAVNGVTQYTAYIWDPHPGMMVFQQATTDLSVAVPVGSALQVGRFYFYSVQACNGSACGPLARWEGFTTTASAAPGVVTLTQPPEGAQNVSLTPALQWAAPTGALPGSTQYTAYVWDPQANAMRFQQTTTALDVAVPGSADLVLSHFYYWTVQACNGAACGPLARWIGFTTLSSVGAPLLRAPAEGATGVGVTPTIAWIAPSGSSPGNTQYTVFVWDPAASVMKFQQTTTALSTAVPFSSGLVAGHFYYYSVQACDGSICGPLARWEGFTS